MNIRHELIMATSKFIPSVAFHPGVTLAEKLKEINMSIKEFALRASKPEKTIDRKSTRLNSSHRG